MDTFGNIDSKFRFIILASKRAKQLLKGAKPKIKAKSRNLIRIAQTEVKLGLIDYEIIPTGKEDIPERDDRVFVGADIVGDEIGEAEPHAGKDVVGEAAGKDAVDEVETEDEEEEEAEEELEDGLKEDKED